MITCELLQWKCTVDTDSRVAWKKNVEAAHWKFALNKYLKTNYCRLRVFNNLLCLPFEYVSWNYFHYIASFYTNKNRDRDNSNCLQITTFRSSGKLGNNALRLSFDVFRMWRQINLDCLIELADWILTWLDSFSLFVDFNLFFCFNLFK